MYIYIYGGAFQVHLVCCVSVPRHWYALVPDCLSGARLANTIPSAANHTTILDTTAAEYEDD